MSAIFVTVGPLALALRISRSTLLRRIEYGFVREPDVKGSEWRRWSVGLAARIIMSENKRLGQRYDVPREWLAGTAQGVT